MPESRYRNDGVTMPCPRCPRPFTAIGRQRYCSAACRQATWRRRDAPTLPALPPRVPRAGTVDECPACGARFLGEQRCPDCHQCGHRRRSTARSTPRMDGCGCAPGRTCTPSRRTLPTVAVDAPSPRSAGPCSWSRWNACRARRASPSSCGCGGVAPRPRRWPPSGGRPFIASTWSIPTGFASRRSPGPPRASGLRSRPSAGPGWCGWLTRHSAWPAARWRIGACRGSGLSVPRGAPGLPPACARRFRSGWSPSTRPLAGAATRASIWPGTALPGQQAGRLIIAQALCPSQNHPDLPDGLVLHGINRKLSLNLHLAGPFL
jgi:hypothetical protein